MHYILVTVLLLVIALPANAGTGVVAPDGWRYPVESDFVGDWKLYRKKSGEPVVVRGDFDGNGHRDEAWLLIPAKNDGWGLWVFMFNAGGKPNPQLLTSSNKEPPQRMGLSLAKPETYKTACGKGYWDCSNDETPSVRLALPGIDLYVFESASFLYYFDTKQKKFHGIATSD